MKQDRILVILALITLVGAVLRAHQLGLRLLWLDEARIFWISQGSLRHVLQENGVWNSAPPLFPILIGLVSQWSKSEGALRALPWIAGTLAIPAMFILGRNFLSTPGALAGSLLMALAVVQIRYSQEMREYSLTVLLVIVLLVSFLRFLALPSWRRAAVLAAIAAVGLFSQYGLALLILGLNGVMAIYMLRMKGARKEVVVKWCAIQCALLVVALVVIRVSLADQWQRGGFWGEKGEYLAQGYWAGGDPVSAVSFAYRGTRSLIEFAFPGLAFAWVFYLGALATLLQRRSTLLPFIVIIPFCVVVAAALLRLYPYLAARQDLVLTPLLYLVAAVGIDYIITADRKFILLAIVVAMLIRTGVSSIAGYYRSGEKSDLGVILRPLTNFARPGDPVYVCNADDPVIAYYFRVRFPQYPLVERDLGSSPRDYLDQADRLAEEHSRTWLLLDHTCGEMNPFLDHLRKHWEVDPIEERSPIQLYAIGRPS